jgi:hypothetical protein
MAVDLMAISPVEPQISGPVSTHSPPAPQPEEDRPMHASITHFPGDPDELEARYDALLAEVPTEGMDVHLCLRAPEGLVVVDTCPSEEAFRAFHDGEAFRALRARHRLPDPTSVEDFPVHVAIARGLALAARAG